MGILFCVIHCTPEVYVYCNKLSVAHQGDRFTSCENIISCTQTLLLSPAFLGIYPVRHRKPLFTFTCNPWSTVLKLQVTGNIIS